MTVNIIPRLILFMNQERPKALAGVGKAALKTHVLFRRGAWASSCGPDGAKRLERVRFTGAFGPWINNTLLPPPLFL